MNITTFNKIIEDGYLKNSTPIARLLDYFSDIYQEEYEPSIVLSKLNSIISNCPDYSGESNLDVLNRKLKIYMYLCSRIGQPWDNESNSSSSTDKLIALVASELTLPTMNSKKEYLFLLILLYYTLQMEDKDYSSALRKSQLSDWLHGFIPSILSQEIDSVNQFPTSVIKSVINSGKLPLYAYDYFTKGFFVPRGYRLEISHDGEPGKTVEAGQYSGSNYSFEDIMNNVHPDWNLVQTGNNVDDNYSTQPNSAAEPIYSGVEQFVGNTQFAVASGYHVATLDLVNYPEEIVIEDLKQRLGVQSAEQLHTAFIGSHPDIDMSQVKSVVGIKKDGSIYMNFFLENEDGENVFEMERCISEDGTTATHDSLFILENMQGKGIGKSFYDAQENFYKNIGVEQISLHANSDVGGYAWARLGYDFKDPERYSAFVRNRGFVKLQSLMSEGVIDGGTFDSIWGDLQRCKSAQDFIKLGYDSSDERVKSFGKTVMLGSSWEGVKKLWKGN